MKGDTISRKAIKEYIKQSDLTNKEKMALHIAINNIEAVDAAPKWISVNDRLPEENGAYLVAYKYNQSGLTFIDVSSFCKNGALVDKYYLGGEKNIFYGYDSEYGFYPRKYVQYWQSLPEPPKMDAEEGSGKNEQ